MIFLNCQGLTRGSRPQSFDLTRHEAQDHKHLRQGSPRRRSSDRHHPRVSLSALSETEQAADFSCSAGIRLVRGVSTLYAASGKGHASHTHSLATVTSTGSKIARRTGPSTNSLLQINTLPPAAQSEPVLLRSRDDDDDDDKDNDDDDEDDDDRSDPSSTVGLSLISGFVLMLLIEQWTHSHNSPGDSAPAYARQQSTLPLLPSQQADGGGDWHRLQRRASTTGVDAGDLADEEEGRSAGGSPPITPRMDDVLGARDWREVLVRFPKSASATFALVVHRCAPLKPCHPSCEQRIRG